MKCLSVVAGVWVSARSPRPTDLGTLVPIWGPMTEVHLEIDERGVATITIDDPERYNPLTRDAYATIQGHLDDIEGGDTRCVVFEGAGDAFSGGGDVEGMGDSLDAGRDPAAEIDEIRTHEQAAVERVYEFPVPTVAKVDGPAVADGAALAVACDATLASKRARLGFTHVRFGLSLDAGASYLLPRLVGEKRALDLALRGELVGAERAHELGLVTRVFPTGTFDTEADAYVAELAAGPPLAQREIKRLVRESWNRSLPTALDEEARTQAIMFDTDDYREGVRAFLDDRDPEFEGR